MAGESDERLSDDLRHAAVCRAERIGIPNIDLTVLAIGGGDDAPAVRAEAGT